ncbi:MAG TPA: SDR family oxidoreductase [Polyangiaceae bacterium]|nr:SDR family oxidoreductase [Polyangiaceae bacterium]
MILLTGATGNVGREVARQLSALGPPFRVLVRDENKVAHLNARVERARGDLNAPDTLAAAMAGVDQLFLLTVDSGSTHTAHAIEAAKRASVRNVVLLSSMGAAAERAAPAAPAGQAPSLGRWYVEREEIVIASGIPWTFVRPGMFMANALRWANTVRTAGVVYDGASGDGKTAPIDEQDIAAVAVRALTESGHAGKSYLLTGTELLTAREQVDILSDVLQKPIRCVAQTPAEVAESLRKAGAPAALVEGLLQLRASVRVGRVARVSSDFEEVMGRKPRTFRAWCQAHASEFA